ncbi:MAG: phytanoyl-CoA dioxygenase [Myxococcales bacterium]|nr:phytanoyl-CoA dioxygenase [Myxococcales bacterium]|tara:strand:- start:2455 stop:3273 length:819 start_codon:yes stop_codon:yes gene_type:complete
MTELTLKAMFDRDGYVVIPTAIDPHLCQDAMARAWTLADDFAPADLSAPFTTDPNKRYVDRYFLNSARSISVFYEDPDVVGGETRRPNKIGHALHERDVFFSRFARLPIIQDAVARLGIQNPKLIQSMVVFKTAHGGGSVNWHRDSTFLFADPYPILGIWIALEPARLDNGCLQVSPGSHSSRLPTRYIRTSDDSCVFDQMSESRRSWHQTAAIEVDTGSMVLMHGHLAHASMPNRSSRSRLAFTLHVLDGRSHYASDNWLRTSSDDPFRSF